MAGCGATYEAGYWGRDLKVVCVEKANIERSGAVAQGLYAINCYMGMQWDENRPEDHCPLRPERPSWAWCGRIWGYDIARHVDSNVHKFEEWGLPIMKDPETGRYQREGKWQIMIHGESYKPIVAEAARKAAAEVYNRIMVTPPADGPDEAGPRRRRRRLQRPHRGFPRLPRQGRHRVAAGGASHIFKPRAVGEGMGRTWYAPWSSASAYALPILVGAKMTQDGEPDRPDPLQGRLRPGRRLLPHLKTYTENRLRRRVRVQVVRPHQGAGRRLHRHASGADLPAQPRAAGGDQGRPGPIRMVTTEAFADPHKEQVGWENFLGMTIGQAVVWASQNIDPKHTNPELTTSEPYVMGSHATCSGAWASGPEDCAPADYQWGYNRMMTVDGLFGAGDTIGGSAHKFSSGSFTEGRIAGKAAVNYVNDLKGEQPQVSEQEYEDLRKAVFRPLETYRVGRNEIVAGTVSPSYMLPLHGLQRLEKIMDEYVGGISAAYTTNEPMLRRGLELLAMLREDLDHLGAEDLHQLQRAWELHHRVLASESVTHHTLFRTETRWPGYYYRGDHPKLDDAEWHCFTLSRYDRESGEWAMEKAPVYHIVD